MKYTNELAITKDLGVHDFLYKGKENEHLSFFIIYSLWVATQNNLIQIYEWNSQNIYSFCTIYSSWN